MRMKNIYIILFILYSLSCDNFISIIIEDKGLIHKNWYVHPDSTLNTIQAALDSCRDGDTVTVAVGTYHENIVWPNTSGIYLRSESGPEQTVIDGDSLGRVIAIVNAEVATVKGFTIQHGYGDAAGMYVQGTSNISITNNIIKENYSNYNVSYDISIIRCDYHNSAINIIDNDINHNEGIAIVVWGGFFTATGNTIDHNRGAIYCQGGEAIITGNMIMENEYGQMVSLADMAGGISCSYCSLAVVTDNIIAGNRNTSYFHFGGGLLLWNCGGPDTPVRVERNTIMNNYSDLGGGIYVTSSNVEMYFNLVAANTSWVAGAGLYVGNYTEAKICGCAFQENSGITSNEGGDGIRVNHGRVAVTYCDFINNANYGVINDSSSNTVDARLNWWGDPSGPGGAGPGTGDSVSAHVIFEPWLTAPWYEETRGKISSIRVRERSFSFR